jgi:hypothetical protein
MKPDVAVAAPLVSKLPLIAVHYTQLEAKLVKPWLLESSIAWRLDPVDVRWGIEEEELRVIAPYRVWITNTPKDGVSVDVTELVAIIRLDYKCPADVILSDDELSHFAGIQGVMHSWPYLRTQIQSLTTTLELPPLTLPPLLSGHIQNFVSASRLVLPEGPVSEPPEQMQVARPSPVAQPSPKAKKLFKKRRKKKRRKKP